MDISTRMMVAIPILWTYVRRAIMLDVHQQRASSVFLLHRIVLDVSHMTMPRDRGMNEVRA